MSDAIAGALIQGAFTLIGIVVAIRIGQQSSEAARQLVIDERKRQADIVAAQIAAKIRSLVFELDMRERDIGPSLEKVQSDGVLLSESLRYKFVPFDTSWTAERRQNLLLFDPDTGVRVQSFFDSVETGVERIEHQIQAYDVLEKTPDNAEMILGNIKHDLHAMRDTASDVLERLDKVHKLGRFALH